MKTWRTLAVVVFVIGVVSFAHVHNLAVGSQVQRKTISLDDAEPAMAFVAKYVDSQVDANGKVTITGDQIRYVKADGEWRSVAHRYRRPSDSAGGSGRVSVYGGTPEGVYERTGSDSRRYVSESGNPQVDGLYRSGNYLRAHPGFVRTQELAGLTVYVHRTEVNDPANPQIWIENGFSAKTGNNPLLVVIHFRDGSEIRSEAVSVQFTEVSETLNDDIKSLPIKKKDN